MQRTKKQHYVPQAALRRFSNDGERIFVYDKISNEVRVSNIRDVAQQRYFYDIPQEVIPANLQQTMDRQTVEHTLSKLEGDFNTVVERVLRKAGRRNLLRRFWNFITFTHGKIISRRDKKALCFFVALQYLRTREFRLTIQDGLEQFEAAIRKRVPVDQIDLFFEGFRGVNEVDVRMHHLSLMLNNEFVDELTTLLYGHILVIGQNHSQHKLYTSDNPMVRHAHKRHPVLRNIGIGSRGIEIAMPLSSDHILIFMERTHFAPLAKSDRKLVNLVEGNIEYYNSLQVRGCDRQVYCETDDFELARDCCRRWPERCAAQRRRVAVE
jgi:hypothetical protein